MQSISFYLKKFEALGTSELQVKQVFMSTVEHLLNVALPPESVSVRGAAIHVTAHPALKSELRIKQEAILAELIRVLGSKRVSRVH